MRKCIWCRRDESETDFKKEAHTIPRQLGGQNICANVCDDCNHYFGNAMSCPEIG
ncbi:MAG: HNH endonuclease [Cyclobacteriaceae bacterium]